MRFNSKYDFFRDHRFRVYMLGVIWILIFSMGCAGWLGFPSYFDPTTYKNLTDLKPQVLLLYDSFTDEDLNKKNIQNIRLKLAQIYEYEKGKGEQNRETYAQIELVQRIFERHIKDRNENERWSEIHLNNQKQNISEAFDIAIQTENLKNKNK